MYCCLFVVILLSCIGIGGRTESEFIQNSEPFSPLFTLKNECVSINVNVFILGK